LRSENERKLFEDEVYLKLKEAELEAKSTYKRLTHEQVFADLKQKASSTKVKTDHV